MGKADNRQFCISKAPNEMIQTNDISVIFSGRWNRSLLESPKICLQQNPCSSPLTPPTVVCQQNKTTRIPFKTSFNNSKEQPPPHQQTNEPTHPGSSSMKLLKMRNFNISAGTLQIRGNRAGEARRKMGKRWKEPGAKSCWPFPACSLKMSGFTRFYQAKWRLWLLFFKKAGSTKQP